MVAHYLESLLPEATEETLMTRRTATLLLADTMFALRNLESMLKAIGGFQ